MNQVFQAVAQRIRQRSRFVLSNVGYKPTLTARSTGYTDSRESGCSVLESVNSTTDLRVINPQGLILTDGDYNVIKNLPSGIYIMDGKKFVIR